MSKPQIFLTLSGLALGLALFLLPRKVLDNDSEVSSARVGEQNEPLAQTAAPHDENASEEALQSIAEARTELENATEDGARKLATRKLASAYAKADRFDSAAIDAASFAETDPEWALQAGTYYFDAYQYAVDADKSRNMALLARKFLQMALDNQSNLPTENAANAKVRIGLTYLATEQMPMTGILKVRAVLDEHPENELALRNMGRFTIQSRQFDKAIGYWERLIEIAPEDPEAHFYLGFALGQTGQAEKAVQLLERVLSFTDIDPQLRLNAEDYLAQLKKS